MKNVKFLFAAAAAMLMSAGTLHAQTTIRLGVGLPMGSYKAGSFTDWGCLNKNSDKAAASLGFSLGAKYQMHLTKGLNLMFTGDLFFNGVSDTITGKNKNSDSKNPYYINVPLMAGLDYDLALGNAATLYVEAGAGLNVRLMSGYTGASNIVVAAASTNITYTPAFSFAYQAGLGLKFSGRYSIGVNYYALGSADVKGKWEASASALGVGMSTGKQDFSAGKINPSILTVRLGMEF